MSVAIPNKYGGHVTTWFLGIPLLLTVWLLFISIPLYELIPLLIAVIILATFIIRFEWGVYLLVFLIPIHEISLAFSYAPIVAKDPYPYNLHLQIFIGTPVIISSFLGLILARWSKIKNPVIENPLRFPITIFFIYAGLTILLYAIPIDYSVLQFFVLTIDIILYTLIIHAISNEAAHRRLMWCCLISGVIHSLVAISFYFLGQHEEITFTYSITEDLSIKSLLLVGYQYPDAVLPQRGSAFTGPHEFSLILNIVLAIAVGLFLTEKNAYRRLFIIISIPLLIAVNLLTMSMAGIGSLFIMVFFLSAAIKKLRKHFFAITSCFIIFAIGAVLLENILLNAAIGEELSPRILTESTGTGGEGNTGLSPRLRFWESAFDNLKEQGGQFLGLGMGSVLYYLKVPHAHNIYFSFFFDFGLMGAGVLLWIIIALLRDYLSMLRHQNSYSTIMCVAILGALVAFGVHGFVDFWYNRPVLWLVLGIAIATVNLARRELLKQQAVTSGEEK